MRQGKRLDYEVWIVRYKDGTTETIDPGDLWALHGEDIARRLQARGIPVFRKT